MNGKTQFYQNNNYRNNGEKTRNYQQQSYVHNVPQNQTSYMQPTMSYYVSIRVCISWPHERQNGSSGSSIMRRAELKTAIVMGRDEHFT